jgi:hypothetical protein
MIGVLVPHVGRRKHAHATARALEGDMVAAMDEEPVGEALVACNQERVDDARHLMLIEHRAAVAHLCDHVGDPSSCGAAAEVGCG